MFAMLGIARFLSIADVAPTGVLPRTVLVLLGIASLLVGALFILRQESIRRLMAYSSVEHMGVIALGFGFGGPLGIAGALYHMLNYSLNMSLMFFGAGNVMRSYGTKEIKEIREVSSHFPVQASLWLAGAVAITGAPPFGLFLSELIILRADFRLATGYTLQSVVVDTFGGRLQQSFDWAVYAMAFFLLLSS